MTFIQPSRIFAQPVRRCLRSLRTVFLSSWVYPSQNCQREAWTTEIFRLIQSKTNLVEEMMTRLCALTPVCAELPGKHSSSSSVSGVPATESYGRIQQNCLLLWRRWQSHQHWGLLWHLFWVHEQVWGEQERLICSNNSCFHRWSICML